MRRYSFIIALHILLIALIGVGIVWLAFIDLWFSSLMLFFLWVGIAYNLYRLQMIQIRMLSRLTESIRHDDMMIGFSLSYQNPLLQQMGNELAEAVQHFRTHSMEHNEMEAWQKLIRVLTHEIMNSITPIISLSETLSNREVNEENYHLVQQGLQTIHRRSKGLLEFVENYRKLTRMPEPTRNYVSLCDLLQGLRELFPDEFIKICLPPVDRMLYIDRTQIEQVLINLLKNAKEATTHISSPCITVWSEYPSSYQSRILVKDNGEGILPEVKDRIFVPFFTTKPSGSGIGLSLCKQIMNRHGGNIIVQSALGKGSCFTLLFG